MKAGDTRLHNGTMKAGDTILHNGSIKADAPKLHNGTINERRNLSILGTQEVISILDGWIIEILNMVADLAEIAEKILKCEKKSNRMQVSPQIVILWSSYCRITKSNKIRHMLYILLKIYSIYKM